MTDRSGSRRRSGGLDRPRQAGAGSVPVRSPPRGSVTTTSTCLSRSRCWPRTGPTTRTSGTGSWPRPDPAPIRDPRLVQVYDIGIVAGRPAVLRHGSHQRSSFNDLCKAGCEPVRGLRLGCRGHAGPSRCCTTTTSSTATYAREPAAEHRARRQAVLIADLAWEVDGRRVGATMTAGTPSYMAAEQALRPAAGPPGGHLLTDRRDVRTTDRAPPFVTRSIADILARDPERPPTLAARSARPRPDGVMMAALPPTEPPPPTALVLAEGRDDRPADGTRQRWDAEERGYTDRPAEATVVTNPDAPAPYYRTPPSAHEPTRR